MGYVSDGRGDLGGEKKGQRHKGTKKMDTGLRRYDKPGTFGPEDVLAYIYGVLHSPVYRERYGEFLKIDFPRVPVPRSRDLFVRVCEVGQALMGLHLLESEVLEEMDRYPAFAVEGDNVVEKGYPKYVVKEDQRHKGTEARRDKSRGVEPHPTDGHDRVGRVYINGEQYFDGVRVAVWEFRVGGYQVCEKWLKDRRGRSLSYEDIVHYQKVVVALGETIGLMGEACLNEMLLTQRV